MWSRFAWWLEHDQNAFATLTQAVSAALTAIVTAILYGVTYHYMVLTRKLSETAHNQLRASVCPIIKIVLSFGGTDTPNGYVLFMDEITVEIENAGSSPVVFEKVSVTWNVTDEPKEGIVEVETASCEAAGFRQLVLTPNASHRDRLPRIEATVRDLEAWSDCVSVTAICEDVGGLALIEYFYRPVDGLKVTSI